MAKIVSLSSEGTQISFGANSTSSNTISILTGPNGSGKTRALTQIAYHFRYGRQIAEVEVSSPPSRIVVQTFSPFSRFPAPSRVSNSLSDVYADEKIPSDQYRAVGIHRSMRHTGGSFARHVLEQAIFRLTESVEQFELVSDVLEHLEFKPSIDLSYKAKPALKVLFSAHQSGDLFAMLQADLKANATDLRSVKSQIKNSDLNSVAALLAAAFDVLDFGLLEKREVDFSMSFRKGEQSRKYAEFQSLAVVRRFNLLSLTACKLTTRDGAKVDLSQTSSGQQQLICSLLGLASEVRDNSIVLIDEPELSLHPSWQITILSRLQQVLRVVENCHVILATHSPLLVQAAQEAKLEILNLNRDGGDPEPAQNEARPSVEEALINVFETPISNSLYLANELMRIVGRANPDVQSVDVYDKMRLTELRSVYTQPGGERVMIEKAEKLLQSLAETKE